MRLPISPNSQKSSLSLSGFDLVGDLVVGILGSLVEGFFFGLIGIASFGLIGSLVTATVGAVVLLWLIRLLK